MDTETPTRLELRFDATEIRMADDGQESRTLTGVLVPYNKPAKMRYFSEQFAPGAFTDSIADTTHNKRALYHHDSKDLLASTNNGTFRLIDTPEALRFEIDVANTTAGNDVLELVRAGEVRGMSAGFNMLEDRWTFDEATDHATRTITKARIVEGTVTSIPAYTDTEVSLRDTENEEAIQAKIAELRAKHKGTPELDKRWMVYRRQIADAA